MIFGSGRTFLSFVHNGRPLDGMVGIAEVYSLVAVRSSPFNQCSGERKERELTTWLRDPFGGRSQSGPACLCTAHLEIHSTPAAGGLSSFERSVNRRHLVFNNPRYKRQRTSQFREPELRRTGSSEHASSILDVQRNTKRSEGQTIASVIRVWLWTRTSCIFCSSVPSICERMASTDCGGLSGT